MTRRAIVHIGPPRTATTAFQSFLYYQRAELAGRGLLYPDLRISSETYPTVNHQHLGEALDGRRPAGALLELLGQLQRQVAETGAETIILSYEGLGLLSARSRGPDVLGDALASLGFVMETFLTVRPQSELINSQYAWRAQYLRRNRPFRLAFLREMAAPRYDYERLVEPWRRASPGGVRAAPLQDRRSDAALAIRIMRAAGLAGYMDGEDESELADRPNRSPGPISMEVARRLRAGGVHLRLAGHAARAATEAAERIARDRALDPIPFNGVDADLRELAAERFAPSNERFARLVWGEGWGDAVADPPPRPVNDLAVAGIDEAKEREIRSILDAVTRQFGLPPPLPAWALPFAEAAHLGRAGFARLARRMRPSG